MIHNQKDDELIDFLSIMLNEDADELLIEKAKIRYWNLMWLMDIDLIEEGKLIHEKKSKLSAQDRRYVQLAIDFVNKFCVRKITDALKTEEEKCLEETEEGLKN